MIYLVFESSKGRKDLVKATTDLSNAEGYSEFCSTHNEGWTYRVYEVEELDDFYVDRLTPISTWKNGEKA